GGVGYNGRLRATEWCGDALYRPGGSFAIPVIVVRLAGIGVDFRYCFYKHATKRQHLTQFNQSFSGTTKHFLKTTSWLSMH
ncbi:MAG TPA: hypothetical protein VLH16_00180, partial [Bacteroidales bacterium]|nr:hypothetical protein [Bacteroidales bacterium]